MLLREGDLCQDIATMPGRVPMSMSSGLFWWVQSGVCGPAPRYDHYCCSCENARQIERPAVISRYKVVCQLQREIERQCGR